MKRLTIYLIVTLLVQQVFAQSSIVDVLRIVEANNPTIKALDAHFSSVKADVRSDILPPNPTAEFGRFPAMQGSGMKYAWGASQHFEFPTVYAKASQLAKATDQLSDLQLRAAKQDILLDAKHVIIDLIYSQKLLAEHKERENYTKSILSVIQKKVDVGQASSLDLNNARLRVAEVSQKVMESEARVRVAQQRLLMMNGNNTLPQIDPNIFAPKLNGVDSILSIAYNLDPRFEIAKQMVNRSSMQFSLTKHKGLPELEIGYQSEKTDTEHFAGFRAGLSIPLWGNTGKVRAAKMNLNAMQAESESFISEIKLYYHEKYIDAQNMQARINDLKQAIASFSNMSLLRKALDLGQVSIIDFFQEAIFIYQLNDNLLEIESEYHKQIASLYRFEL